jgi:hypothetical protein
MPPLGLGRGGDVAEGHLVSETPGLKPRMKWGEAGLLTRLAGGPIRGDLAHVSSFVDFSP